jgi:hypothetical protein
MTLLTFRRRVAEHLTNRAGWQSNRKIVVIESDDWGSIRMPSNDAYKKLQSKGVPVEQSPYCRYDSLASESDLEHLFELLLSFQDSQGNPPLMTANCVVSNPDFKKIEASNFIDYHCEPITATFERYPNHKKCFDLWREGDRNRIFRPQSHGKEHLNPQFWLELLRNGHMDFKTAFQQECWGLSTDIYPEMKRSVQAAFDMEQKQDFSEHVQAIVNGLDLFEELFGYRSESFIANNYIWSEELNKVLAENGVKYLQGMKYQKLPIFNKSNRKMIRRFIGEKNDYGQYHLIRNCTFEPSLKSDALDCVEECLNGIKTAFLWNRPAIICSHRINYVGYLDADNRDKSLRQLKQLLNGILKQWPDVEFMSSDQLGRLIESEDEHARITNSP